MTSSLPDNGSNLKAAQYLLNPKIHRSVNGQTHVGRASSIKGDARTASPRFEARALLDPKRFVKRPASEGGEIGPNGAASPLSWRSPNGPPRASSLALPTTNGQHPADNKQETSDLSGLIEKIHGVSTRESRPSKRPKLDDPSNENGDADTKVSNFTGGGKGGVIGQYMKEKKEEGKREAASNGTYVDLTGGDEDEDVVVVRDSSQVEVCYGRLDGALALAHAVPSPSPTAQELDPAFWPVIRVELERKAPNTHIIGVVDPLGNDFGTVASSTAIGLAPLMDAPNIGVRVQARIPTRRKKPEEILGQPISAYYELNINLYGQRKYVAAIGKYLAQKHIWLQLPMGVDAGIETVNPHAKVRPVHRMALAGSTGVSPSSGYITRTVEEIRQDVLGVFDTLQKSENVPEMEPDPRVLTPLLAHQKQALYFMTEKEKEQPAGNDADGSYSLWRLRVRNNGQRTYFNVITGKEERTKPAEIQGGILADMMGLGKTLSILSLLMSTLDTTSESWATKKPPLPESTDDLPLVRNSKSTLLVSPLSTIANWEEQIRTHIAPGALSYYIYHGSNRCSKIAELAKYDIVITTYNVVASEFDKRSKKVKDSGVSPLQQTNWFRIVLDEAHMIREQSTRQSKAICALSAERRWAVTGTPVQNRLDDLGALIKFLRIKPFDEKGGFTQFILSPFKNADPEILPKLRLLVDSVTLRRLKDRIDLPRRHDRIVRLQFDNDEKALYELFAKDSANKMNVVAADRQSSLGGKAYVHVLRAILRLRLICAHGKELLSEEDLKIMEGASMNNAIDLDDEDEGKPALSSRQAYDMFSLMKETNADVCNQCDRRIAAPDPMTEETTGSKDDVIGYMTPCFQLLCRECIKSFKQLLERNATDSQHATCPLCQTYIRSTVFELKQSKVDADEDAKTISRDKVRTGKKITNYGGPHAKTRALLHFLQESRLESEAHPEQKPIKSVVFSGWTTHLDLIQMALEDNHVRFVRLDGRMSRIQRTTSLDVFREDPSVIVILVSISAGGLGLNLTTASKVYVMEPQFNPAAEAQAIDRIHRLGQTREVTTTRFIMAGSFEEKMLELQRKKQNLADLSMNRGKLDKNEATKRRLEELRSLFK